MKSSIAIKSAIASFLNSLGVISLELRNYTRNSFVFLMYHRVIPKDKAEYVEAGMYVEPETLETHIRFTKRHFEIVPLAEVCSRNSFFNPPSPPFRKGGKGGFEILPLRFAQGQNDRKGRGKNGKPLCILTFDDGWYDFYEYAFPILKTYRVPATVFLPTDFIGTRKWFWTDQLAKLFFQKQRAWSTAQRAKSKEQRVKGKKTNPLINQLGNLKGSLESQLEKAIQMLKAYRDEEIEDILTELSKRWNIDPDPLGRVFLSWEEVREIVQSGLISFGSHTASHRILTTLTDKEVQDELIRSKEKLIAEKAVDSSFIPFSYPNGNYNEKIARMVKEAGYSLSVTTENGWNGLNPNLFTLKRVGIHQDMTSTEAMLGCRITGIF